MGSPSMQNWHPFSQESWRSQFRMATKQLLTCLVSSSLLSFPKTRLSGCLGFKPGLHLSSLHPLLNNSSMTIPLTVFMWVAITWHPVLKVPSSWLRYPGIYTILAFGGLIGIPNLIWSKRILTREIIQISLFALTHVALTHCYSKQSPSVALGLCCQKALLLSCFQGSHLPLWCYLL